MRQTRLHDCKIQKIEINSIDVNLEQNHLAEGSYEILSGNCR